MHSYFNEGHEQGQGSLNSFCCELCIRYEGQAGCRGMCLKLSVLCTIFAASQA